MKKKIVQTLSLALACVMLVGTPLTTEAAAWKKNSKGWWYQNDDRSWPANQWKKINGKWYYFNGSGYMTTGWQKVKGKWYYMNASGAMLANTWVGNYYVTGSGAMATNCWIGNTYVDGSGKKTQATQSAKWMKNSKGWWYRNADGSWPANKWMKINGKWYYFNGSGYMTTGWQKVKGKWYYMNSSGAMLSNTWVGNYYVTGSGAMATNTWIGSTYVDGSGKKTQTTQTAKWMQDSNGWWYRNADGSYPADKWMKIDNVWYHFNESGYMETNKWVDGWYYVTGSGAMAVNTWIGDAYVGADGKYIPYYGEDREEETETIAVCNQCGFYTTDVELMDYHLLYEGHSCSAYDPPHTHVWEETTITLKHNPVWHSINDVVAANRLEEKGYTEADVRRFSCSCGCSIETLADANQHMLDTDDIVWASISKTIIDQAEWTETKEVRQCPYCRAVKGYTHYECD